MTHPDMSPTGDSDTSGGLIVFEGKPYCRGSDGLLLRTLYEAAKRDDLVAIRNFIDAGFDVDQFFVKKKGGMELDPEKRGSTALMCAASEGNGKAVELLLELGASIDLKGGDSNWNALMYAAWRRQYVTTRVLIDRGAKLDSVDGSGMTPLMLASAAGDESIVQLMVDRGARIDASLETGDRALHFAIRSFKGGVMDILFRAGEQTDGALPDGKRYDEFLSESPECLAVIRSARARIEVERVLGLQGHSNALGERASPGV
jgi:hypothetical protein